MVTTVSISTRRVIPRRWILAGLGAALIGSSPEGEPGREVLDSVSYQADNEGRFVRGSPDESRMASLSQAYLRRRASPISFPFGLMASIL